MGTQLRDTPTPCWKFGHFIPQSTVMQQKFCRQGKFHNQLTSEQPILSRSFCHLLAKTSLARPKYVSSPKMIEHLTPVDFQQIWKLLATKFRRVEIFQEWFEVAGRSAVPKSPCH